MCGICGAVAGSNITEHEQNKVRQLLFMNTFRGRDSTGMFDYIKVAPEKGFIFKHKGKKKEVAKEPVANVYYWKSIEPAYAFAMEDMVAVQQGRWKDHMLKAVVCHARAATVGKISEENAHPFVYNNIIGVHNGTIGGEFEGKKEHEVDSAALIMNIQKQGVKKALEDIYKTTSSVAYALVWMDTDKNMIYFLRNYQRPLHYYARSGTVYFSSDKRDLQYVFDLKDDHYDLKEFEANTLYSLDLSRTGYKFDEAKMYISRPVIPYAPASANQSNNYARLTPEEIARRSSHWSHRSGATELNDPTFDLLNNRSSQTYTSFWRQKTWKEFADQGQSFEDSNHPNYDIAHGRWFTPFVFSMLQNWIMDHNIEYTATFKKVWDELTDKSKKFELEQCTFVPTHLLATVEAKGTGTGIDMEVASKGLQFPFGTSGRKCSERMFKHKVKDGCALCSVPVMPEEAFETFWIDDDNYLCNNCAWEVAYSDKPEQKGLANTDKVIEFLDKCTARTRAERPNFVN